VATFARLIDTRTRILTRQFAYFTMTQITMMRCFRLNIIVTETWSQTPRNVKSESDLRRRHKHVRRTRQPRVVGRKYRSPREDGGCTPAKRGRRHTPGSCEAPPRRSKPTSGIGGDPYHPWIISSDSQRLGVGEDANSEGARGTTGPIDARTPLSVSSNAAQGSRKR
jgi:hypothetical protein